jgi:uncharacterized protein YbjT (DUF2867 family)
MYVILGASGHTGTVAAKALLARGEKVRAVGRSKERLAALASQGAESFVADSTQADALTKAFDGARAVYFLIPPDHTNPAYRAHQSELVRAGAQALEAAKIRYVVALSSYGASQEHGTGPVAGLHEMEERFKKIAGLNALFLRPGYFMENLLSQVGVVQNFGMMAGPVRDDLVCPMIATRDIGAAAADALLRLDFSGHQTRELQGHRDVTMTEVARIIGAAIGKPSLAYMRLPNEQVIQAMVQMGMSQNHAELICEMVDAMNDGRMATLEPRSAANTTPTPLEAFVQDTFVPAYGGKAASANR